MSAGSQLKKLRERQGRSIREVVDASDGILDKTTVSRIERGERGVSLRAAYCFARIYGVSMEELSEIALKKRLSPSETPFDVSLKEKKLIGRYRTLTGKHKRLVAEITNGFAYLGDYKSLREARDRLLKEVERLSDEKRL